MYLSTVVTLIYNMKPNNLIYTGLELARVPGVPGARGIFWTVMSGTRGFWQFFLHKVVFQYISPLNFEDLLVIGTHCFKFPTQALIISSESFCNSFSFHIIRCCLYI